MTGPFRGALALAIFLVLMSALMLIGQPADSPEFVVTVLSLVVGLVFLAVVIWAIRRLSK
ncbi:MAG TPA: hypothetical protein VFT99_14965 [Roseiflexaceae bacterium]|nr:hypothetical protein [Roseiflexaceae bacterium]